MMKFTFALSILFSIQSWSASIDKTAVSATAAGVGGAQVAINDAQEAAFANPAAVGAVKGYHLGTSVSSTRRSEAFHLSVLDNTKENLFPAVLGFTSQRTIDPRDGSAIFDRRGSLGSAGWIRKKVLFGAAVTFDQTEQLETRWTQMNGKLGVLFSPTGTLGFGAVVDGVIPADESIPGEFRRPQTSSIGASLTHERYLRTRLDIESAENNLWTKPTARAGVEYYMNRWAIARLGALQSNSIRKEAFTVGMGFEGPQFGLHYAYQNKSLFDEGDRHSIDLQIPVW